MTDAKDETAGTPARAKGGEANSGAAPGGERARVRAAVVKALEDPSMRLRVTVATRVLAIVDREIGRGEKSDDAEWTRLLALVSESDAATRLVRDLRGVIEKCRNEIAERAEKGTADEAELRKTLLGYIRAAVLMKLKAPLTASLDEEPGPAR